MKPVTRARSIRRKLRAIDNHWIWLGATNTQGQPVIRVNGALIPLARYLWAAQYQTVPVRLTRYRCRMRLCVRPTHYHDVGARSGPTVALTPP